MKKEATPQNFVANIFFAEPNFSPLKQLQKCICKILIGTSNFARMNFFPKTRKIRVGFTKILLSNAFKKISNFSNRIQFSV